MVDVASRPLRVLAVDDWQDTTSSIEALLRMWGHEVRVAHDGGEALRAATEFRPDVVFLDLVLGRGPDGYEVARQLRADPLLSGALIVCISGFGSAADRAQTKAAGFDYHFLKPADPNVLRRLLAERQLRGGRGC